MFIAALQKYLYNIALHPWINKKKRKNWSINNPIREDKTHEVNVQKRLAVFLERYSRPRSHPFSYSKVLFCSRVNGASKVEKKKKKKGRFLSGKHSQLCPCVSLLTLCAKGRKRAGIIIPFAESFVYLLSFCMKVLPDDRGTVKCLVQIHLFVRSAAILFIKTNLSWTILILTTFVSVLIKRYVSNKQC